MTTALTCIAIVAGAVTFAGFVALYIESLSIRYRDSREV